MFSRGDQVVERGSMSCVGTVLAGPEICAGEVYYRVSFGGRIKNVLEEDLERFQGEQDVESLLRAGAFGDQVAFARRLTMSKLRRPLRDAVYSYRASRTDFHAYQFKPLLKFLSSDRRRLLIADEVGLGKTIEAGYVLQEERARFDIQRVVVVCPASLRTKWKNELWHRFGEEFDILDRQPFMGKALLREGQSERGLPRLQAIVSLQSLRSNEVIEALETRGAPLDLLIVDEAHHCRNSETKQHRLVRALADLSEAVLLLTATPIHLGDQNLFNLLRLLLPEEFDRFDVFQERLQVNQWIVEAETTMRRGGRDWQARALHSLRQVESTREQGRFVKDPLYRESVELLSSPGEWDHSRLIQLQENLAALNLLTPFMTRTRKRDVYPDAARREAHVVPVKLTPEELEVYDVLSDFCFKWYARHRDDSAARFAIITFQRQLASSLQAALAHFEDAARATPVSDGMEADFGDGDVPGEGEDAGARSLLDDFGFLALVKRCRQRLGRRDRKLSKLLEVLRRPEKTVVFSYFKRSLAYLESQLSRAGIKHVRIDGDVASNPHDPDNDERLVRIGRFHKDPDVRVLLSSEIGSEGLDFQFCHVLINWDLPWNPMVVEQRIGRLDRLGQRAEKILIFSFSCPGTIEDLILSRLYQRIGIFERTIGVLEPILGEEIRDLTDRLFDPRLTLREREELVEEKAKALAQRARDEELLEAESANLVGHDEFFSERIERVRRLGRFVSGQELRVFVEEFLQSRYPQCVPRPAMAGGPAKESSGSHTFSMPVVEGLRDFVRRHLPSTDPAVLRFLGRAYPGRLNVTFSDEVASADGRLELITATHPLVRAIAKHYDENPGLVHAVTAVRVSSNAVPPGDYLFAWASVEETGIRAGRSLWAVVVSSDTRNVLGADNSEMLLHHMVLRGQAWEGFRPPPAETTSDLFEIAKAALARRHQEYREMVRKRNDGLVERRLASVASSYRVKRAERERRLHDHRARGNERAAALLQAQLRKLDAEFDERCRELEEKRAVSVSWNVEGAGYVRVDPEVLGR